MQQITWDDFTKVELRIGTITAIDDFPEARNPAYKLTIDFGEEIGTRRSSAQITNYTKAELVGKQILGVVNFPEKQIGPFMSQCLTTGIYNEEDKVILVSPDITVPNGAKLL